VLREEVRLERQPIIHEEIRKENIETDRPNRR
jgi:hypothetical protein